MADVVDGYVEAGGTQRVEDTAAGNAAAPMFSLVMPVYESEPYLASALDAVLAQTCPDWELIVVDDASSDGSEDIAREYTLRDGRIQLLELGENRGSSAARNAGLEMARGTYVGFLDSDDIFDPDMLERVRESLERDPADIVLFGLVEEYYGPDGEFQYANEVLPRECVCRTPEEVHAQVLDLEKSLLLGYTWNKVYLRERLGDLRYEEGVALIEDAFFNIEFFDRATSANLLAFAPYHYAKRQGGNLTNRYVPEYFELHRRRIEMVYDQQCRWGLDSPEVRSTVGSLYGRYILSALERNCDPRAGMSHADRKAWCRRLFDDELFEKLIPEAHASDSRALDICLWVLRRRSPALCCALGRAIHMVRGNANESFNKVKSQR